MAGPLGYHRIPQRSEGNDQHRSYRRRRETLPHLRTNILILGKGSPSLHHKKVATARVRKFEDIGFPTSECSLKSQEFEGCDSFLQSLRAYRVKVQMGIWYNHSYREWKPFFNKINGRIAATVITPLPPEAVDTSELNRSSSITTIPDSVTCGALELQSKAVGNSTQRILCRRNRQSRTVTSVVSDIVHLGEKIHRKPLLRKDLFPGTGFSTSFLMSVSRKLH